MPDRAARRVLKAWIERLAPVEEQRSLAAWAMACDASDENRARLESAAKEMEAVLHDEVGIGKVDQSLGESVEDPILRRALHRLQLRLLAHRVPRPERLVTLETELPASFARYRAEVDGRRLAAHDVSKTLRESEDDKTLETTWRAAMGVGAEVADRVREAVKLRNEHARASGHADYRAMKLMGEEVDAGALQAFLETLEAGTATAWAEEKARLDADLAARYGVSPEGLRSWHYGDVFLQSLPPEAARPDPFRALDPVALMHRTYEGMGLDIWAAFEKSDLFPREGKNPHAFCTHIDRADDVRVLCNVVPSQRWTRTMLHEFGHAAYDLYLDFELPWNLVSPPHACVTEGIAMLFDRLVHDAGWRETVAGLAPDPEAEARARAELLTFVRWGLVVSLFEAQLYADPDADLDRIWWDLVERLQGIPRPDPVPEGSWAAKIHVACHPVYYHGYLLGQAVASQLGKHIQDELGSPFVDDPGAGRWLVDAVWRPSARSRWDELMVKATGAAPNAEALLLDIVPEVEPAP